MTTRKQHTGAAGGGAETSLGGSHPSLAGESISLPPDVRAGIELARESGKRVLTPEEVSRLSGILQNLGTAANTLKEAASRGSTAPSSPPTEQ